MIDFYSGIIHQLQGGQIRPWENVWDHLGLMSFSSSQSEDQTGPETRDQDCGPPLHGDGNGQVAFAWSSLICELERGRLENMFFSPCQKEVPTPGPACTTPGFCYQELCGCFPSVPKLWYFQASVVSEPRSDR